MCSKSPVLKNKQTKSKTTTKQTENPLPDQYSLF